jgi:hypothetical protein
VCWARDAPPLVQARVVHFRCGHVPPHEIKETKQIEANGFQQANKTVGAIYIYIYTNFLSCLYITSFFSSGHGSQGGQIVCHMMCIVLNTDHQQIDNNFF